MSGKQLVSPHCPRTIRRADDRVNDRKKVAFSSSSHLSPWLEHRTPTFFAVKFGGQVGDDDPFTLTLVIASEW